MVTLRYKARIAVLGIIAAVSMSAHMIVLIIDPATLKLGQEWAATAGSGGWVMMTLFWLGPLWVAYGAMALKSPADRWVTAVGAAALTILNVWHFFVCAVPLLPGTAWPQATPQHILLVGSSALATGAMTWSAWKLPKEEAYDVRCASA